MGLVFRGGGTCVVFGGVVFILVLFSFFIARVSQLEFCISASLQIIQMYVNIRYNNRFPLSEKEA